MNKREKEIFQGQLDAEEKILQDLAKMYQRALRDIVLKIRMLQSDELTQSRIYQIQYQEALKGQIEGILEKLHGDEYSTIQQYLSDTYTDAYVGNMYMLHGQGVPVLIPLDRAAAVKAVVTDSKLSAPLYASLGYDMDKLKKHTLTRAMRVDKMTLAALEATLQSYDQNRLTDIPVLDMLSASPELLQAKAEKLKSLLAASGIDVSVVSVQGQVGGGSVPNQNLPSFAVALTGQVNRLEERLRLGRRPIIGRIHNEAYLLDVRTLWEEDFPVIAAAIKEALA